jgi:uncharacterized cupredoxin-like copper-binding protein
MKILYYPATCLVTVVAISFYHCKPAANVSGSRLLALNLEKGKSYDYEMVWDLAQSFMGEEIPVSTGTFYSVHVQDEADQVRTMTVTHRKVNMQMKMMGMEISIDSDKDKPGEADFEKDPVEGLKKIFTGIVGRSFTLKVDESGNIIEMSGFTEMMEDMLKSLNLPGEALDAGRAALNDQYDEENIKSQFEQVFSFFPNKEVKEGDSWEKTFIVGGRKMPARHSSIYKVKSVDGDHVSLYVTSLIEPASDELAIHGSQTGNLLVDSKTGLVLKAEYEQEMEADAMGMKIEIRGKGKIKGTERKKTP